MDGIDGIAGVQGIIAAGAWATAVSISKTDASYLYPLIIVATLAAFLVHNWHPARVFMGDVGAPFLDSRLHLFL